MNSTEEAPMAQEERSYATRNRRGHPPTTRMDELVNGVPTGAIVSGYSIEDGRAVSHYVQDPHSRPDFSRVDVAEYGRQVVQWQGPSPRARALQQEPTSAEAHMAPAGGYMGPEDASPQPGYIGITRGLEEEPRAEVVAAIRTGTRITSELVRTAARNIADLHPLELAPLEVRETPSKRVTVHEEVVMTTVFVLEFDGPYGPESKEFRSQRDAQEYPQVLRDYFKRDCFSNFRLFRESRSPREQLKFEE